MSRLPLRLELDDISAFARALRGQLAKLDRAPGHVELLSMICRSAGFRNYQHFRTGAAVGSPETTVPALPDEPPRPPDRSRVDKAARYFDANGRLMPHLAALAPMRDKRMGASPYANGGRLLVPLDIPPT